MADRSIADIVRDRIPHAKVATDRDLLSRLIETIGADRRRAPRWSHVGAMLGHGSGVSTAICDAVGSDPDEMVGVRRCEDCGEELAEDEEHDSCEEEVTRG